MKAYIVKIDKINSDIFNLMYELNINFDYNELYNYTETI